jgi:hypothetical protein
MMNLAEWAEAQQMHPQTAYRWFRQGRLPVPARLVGGLIMVGLRPPIFRQPHEQHASLGGHSALWWMAKHVP